MLRYDIVDVFTERPFAGNQLAVVHGGGSLSTAQCLALAKEFNLSETTFPEPVSPSSYAVRIFTPGGEIPFAGHPTLGTAWVLRRSGLLSGESVTQTCGAGDIDVAFLDPGLVSLSAVPRDLFLCPRAVTSSLLADVGLGEEDLAGQAWVAGAGLTFVHLPVSEPAVARARPSARPLSSYDELARLGARDPIAGANVYAGAAEVHSRVFVPGLSIPEDPATGSAAAGLGMALVASGALPSGGRYTIRQGIEMGRPSELHCTVTAADGAAVRVEVAGAVQPVGAGKIAVPTTL